MDDGFEDIISEGTTPAESNAETNVSTSASEHENQSQEVQSKDENKEKKKTVKEILDEVLNCTVIQLPNPSEDDITQLKPVVQPVNKVFTMKEFLGEILEYNVCNRGQPSNTVSPCDCGCKIPPYAPSTSTDSKIHSDLDVSVMKDAPSYSPFQIYSSSTLQDKTLKPDRALPVTVNRLLPSYSSVLRQGPLPKTKSVDSFVPKRPPPSYAEVEGIWEDVPSAVSTDSIIFGPDPLYLICPICRIIVLTQIERERSAITHWIALILCLFLCWPCCLLPYYMKSCSYTYHSCPNCNHYFGMYNPF